MDNYPKDWLCICGHSLQMHGNEKGPGYACCNALDKSNEEIFADSCQEFNPVDNLSYIEHLAKSKGGIKMKLIGVVLLTFLAVPVFAGYRATDAQQDADKANHIDRDKEYPELIAKAEAYIKQESSQGSYTAIFNVNGYRRTVVEHVIDTLLHEGYLVWCGPDDTILTISWDK